jgi:hypothetical protein
MHTFAATPTGRKIHLDPLRFMSGGGLCQGPEHMQPSVQLITKTPKGIQNLGSSGSLEGTIRDERVPRPLPGSFPNRRTIFILDWDDTLCPTTWIRSILKSHMADIKEWCEDELDLEPEWRDAVPGWFSQPLPDEPMVRDWIDELQDAIIATIVAAQAYGVVCIVTNALYGWVDKTVKKWLPKLRPFIFGHGAQAPIKIVYAQQVYQKPHSSVADLPWVDDLGPYMWWKKAAMTLALDEVDELYRLEGCTSPVSERSAAEVCPSVSWCANAGSKRLASVIAIGDDEAEMQAVELAARNYDERRVVLQTEQGPLASSKRLGIPNDATSGDVACPSHWPWVKKVKCKERPHIKQLTEQLHEVIELLPKLVLQRCHCRINMNPSQGYCSEDDRRLRAPSNTFDPSAPCEPRSRDELCKDLLGATECSNKEFVECALRVQMV